MIPPELTPLLDNAPGRVHVIETTVYVWVEGLNIVVAARTDNGFRIYGGGDTVEDAVSAAKIAGWFAIEETVDDGDDT